MDTAELPPSSNKVLSTPKTQTPLLSPNQQMSSALKERLKKCGRWHGSPSQIPKCSSDTTTFPQENKKTENSSTNLNTGDQVSSTKSSSSSIQYSTPKLSAKRTHHQSSTPTNSKFRRRIGGFTSPRIVANKTNDDTNSNNLHCKTDAKFTKTDIASPIVDESGENITPKESLSKGDLKTIVQEKEEVLRKLSLVKRYREKNDLTQLQSLIDKWRSAAQQGLEMLCELSPEPKPSMQELIDHFQISHTLLQYDAEEECFTSS